MWNVGQKLSSVAIGLASIACAASSSQDEVATTETGVFGDSSTDTNSDTDSGVDPDLGSPPSPLEAEGTCPNVDATTIGINTTIRVDYPDLTEIITLPDGGLSVHCGGVEIIGVTSIVGRSILFEPAALLPPMAICTVELPPGAVSNDDRPLIASTWQFTTASEETHAFAFSKPENLSRDLGINQVIASEGDDVVVAWARGPDLMLAVSDDGGLNMTQLDPLITINPPASIEAKDIRLIDGAIHATWRVLSGSESEVFYARTFDDLFTLGPWQFISTPYDNVSAYDPSVTSDGGQVVHVAYAEGPAASSPDTIKLVTSTDGGATFADPVIVDTGEVREPQVAFVDGGLLLMWIDGEAIQFADAEQSFLPFTTLQISSQYPHHLLSPQRMSDASVLLSWMAPDYDTYRHHQMKVSARNPAGFDEAIELTEDEIEALVLMRVAVGDGDRLLRMVSRKPFGSQTVSRELSVAPSWDASFATAQYLDFFFDRGYSTTATTDGQLVDVAGGPNDTAYITWIRQFPDRRWPPQVMFARGIRAAPCSPN